MISANTVEESVPVSTGGVLAAIYAESTIEATDCAPLNLTFPTKVLITISSLSAAVNPFNVIVLAEVFAV